MIDVAGPLQTFYEARVLGQPYTLVLSAPSPVAQSAQGLHFGQLAPLPAVGPDDRVVVPGLPLDSGSVPGKLVAWLARAAANGAEVVAVCTGAFALGQAGLLDGRTCTTHWRRTRELQRRFPRARVVDDRLYVRDGPIVTSAGLAAGIDLALSLVEADSGPVAATSVARAMVVYMRRASDERQESVYLDYHTHFSPGVHRVRDFLAAHPESRSSVAELGRLAGMSARNLTRVFKRASDMSLGQYRTRVRLDRARHLLQNPGLTVDAVASSCGFTNARQLRRLWAQHMDGPMRACADRERR